MIYLLLTGLALLALAALMIGRGTSRLRAARRALLHVYSITPPDYQEIIRICNDAINLNPRDFSWYIQRGWAYRNLKDYKHAIKDFNKSIALKRRNAEAYYRRAAVRIDRKEYQKAIDDLNKAIALRANYAAAYTNRAMVYDKLENYQQAVQDYGRAIEFNPGFARAYVGRGFVYRKLEDNERALQDYRQAIILDPNYLSAYLAIGALYFQTKDYQQALIAYKRAIELQPGNASIYHVCGVIYYWLKEYNQVVEQLNQMLILKPDDANAYHLRGAAYLELGNIQQSLVDLAKSQGLEQTSASPGWMLEWTRMIESRPDEQTATRLEQLTALSSPSHITPVCKGVACWIRGNYDEALAALQQSIAEKPNQEDAHFWQGMTYAALGRDEEARAAIERALQTPFPPLLLAPLRWFEQDRPDFYTAYVAPLLQEKL